MNLKLFKTLWKKTRARAAAAGKFGDDDPPVPPGGIPILGKRAADVSGKKRVSWLRSRGFFQGIVSKKKAGAAVSARLAAFPGHDRADAVQEELAALKAENKRLRNINTRQARQLAHFDKHWPAIEAALTGKSAARPRRAQRTGSGHPEYGAVYLDATGTGAAESAPAFGTPAFKGLLDRRRAAAGAA